MPTALDAYAGSLRDHPSLQDRVYDMLRTAIVQGTLPADSRLIETEVAQALGVSRNPVREAIRRLQQERLVTVRPRSGVFVAGLSIKDIENTYTVRSALEGLASALAARNIGACDIQALQQLVDEHRDALLRDDATAARRCIDRFHTLLHVAADNPRLLDVLVGLNDSISRFRAITSSLPDRRTAILRDHEEILSAIQERDGTRAEWLMRAHIDGSRRRLLAYLAERVREDGGAGLGLARGEKAAVAAAERRA